MFPIQINGRYKYLVKIINRTVALISIGVSFFALPQYLNVAVAISIVLLGFLIEKVTFIYTIVHINPFPQRLRKNQSVSIAYGYLDEEMKKPFIYLVYKTKTEAIEHFKYFESLVLGKLNDEDNNLILSIVFEDEFRYGMFFYPSPYSLSALETKKKFESTLSRNERVNLNVMSYVEFLPALYSGNGNLMEVFKTFTEQTPVALNTCYFVNGEITTVRKKAIKKYHMRIVNRNDLDFSTDVESAIDWFNPLKDKNKIISN